MTDDIFYYIQSGIFPLQTQAIRGSVQWRRFFMDQQTSPDLNALGSTASQAVTTYNNDQATVVKDTQQLTADQQQSATDGAAATAAVQALIAAATQVLANLPPAPSVAPAS